MKKTKQMEKFFFDRKLGKNFNKRIVNLIIKSSMKSIETLRSNS